MQRFSTLIFALAVLTPAAYARPVMPSRDGRAELGRFFAAGGRFETLGGRPIDPEREDLRTLPTVVVRDGSTDRRVILEAAGGALRVRIEDQSGRALLSKTLGTPGAASVRLAAAAPGSFEQSTVGMALVSGGMTAGLLCVLGFPSCLWTGAIFITYVALAEYDHIEDRRHRAPEATPAK